MTSREVRHAGPPRACYGVPTRAALTRHLPRQVRRGGHVQRRTSVHPRLTVSAEHGRLADGIRAQSRSGRLVSILGNRTRHARMVVCVPPCQMPEWLGSEQRGGDIAAYVAGPVAARRMTAGTRDSRAVGAASGHLDHADGRFGALRFHGRIFISSTTVASAAAVPGMIPNLPGSGTATKPCMTPYSAGSHSMPA